MPRCYSPEDVDDPRLPVSTLEVQAVRAALWPRLFAAPADKPRLGRFEIERRIGEGATGRVYLARDPELERPVAVKLVGADTDADRVLREARSMAALTHRNVLGVYDVRRVGDDVFIAMEYAGGGTLRQWCAATNRPWREVLERCVDAAAGLHAAHEAQLVHRDFKPDNVLLLGDGAVRVADFGLAAPIAEAGVRAGTPAYMAPEQHAGGAVGPAADQYAFCVTAWELLHGERPNIDGDHVREPSGSDVPSWVRSVLRRGLRSDPAGRHPSMAALAASLERDPADATRRRRAIGATALAAFVAGIGVYAAFGGSAVAPCTAAPARLASVWNDDARDAIRTAFLASGGDHSNDAWVAASTRLDEYGREWVEAHTAACEATNVTREQSAERLDARMACLDARLRELRALIEVFERADAAVVRRSAGAVLALPQLAHCADVDVRSFASPPNDPALAARWNEARAGLDRVRALWRAGRWAEAREAYPPLLEEARAIDEPSLLAEVLYEGGTGAKALRPDAQYDVFVEAANLAAKARDDRLAARCWIELILVEGFNRGRQEDALELRAVAEAAVVRAGDPDDLRARLANRVGWILDEMGRYDEARAQYEESLERRERVFGKRHPIVASSLNALGDSLRLAGDYAGARDVILRAYDMMAETLGPYHPDLLAPAMNLGDVYLELGDHERARSYTELAIELYKTSNDLDTAAANLRLNLGLIEVAEGDVDRGLETIAGAYRDSRKDRPEHSVTALIGYNYGDVLVDAGRLDEATPVLERSLKMIEGMAQVDRRWRGLVRFALARALSPTAPARAKTLAAAAREDLVAAGARAEKDLEKLERFESQGSTR